MLCQNMVQNTFLISIKNKSHPLTPQYKFCRNQSLENFKFSQLFIYVYKKCCFSCNLRIEINVLSLKYSGSTMRYSSCTLRITRYMCCSSSPLILECTLRFMINVLFLMYHENHNKCVVTHVP